MTESYEGLRFSFSGGLRNVWNGTENSWGYDQLNSSAAPADNLTSTLQLSYHPRSYVITSVILGIIIFAVGVVGNVMVILVVARTKSMRSTTNCYLVSLAFADCMVLITATLPHTVGMFLPINHFPYGSVCCALLTFLSYLGINASSLSITTFTIERYVAICHPMRAHTLCTINRAKKLIVALWIFSIIYNSPWLGLTQIIVKEIPGDNFLLQICTYKLDRDRYAAFYFVDFVLFYAIPLAVTAVLYCLIGRVLFLSISNGPVAKSMKRKSKMEEEGKKESVKRNVTKARIQSVKMLIVVVVLFALLWLPFRALVVYNSLAKKQYLDMWFTLFCRMMIFVNSAINPVLYNLMSIKFRNAFKKLLCNRKSKSSADQGFVTENTEMYNVSLKVRG